MINFYRITIFFQIMKMYLLQFFKEYMSVVFFYSKDNSSKKYFTQAIWITIKPDSAWWFKSEIFNLNENLSSIMTQGEMKRVQGTSAKKLHMAWVCKRRYTCLCILEVLINLNSHKKQRWLIGENHANSYMRQGCMINFQPFPFLLDPKLSSASSAQLKLCKYGNIA